MTKLRKALIVYDDPSVREELQSMLDRYSEFETAWVAGTKKDALAVFKSQSPDLMFLGLRLPDGNGLQVLRRAREACPGLYVVVFTAFYPYISREAFSYGEDDYLLNPFTHDELDRVLRRYLSGGEVGGIHRDGVGADTLAVRTLNNELMPIVRDDIVFFRYDSAKKLWEAMISDVLSLTLRKGTTARDILRIGPQFRQCHQSFIVNLKKVKLIGLTQIKMCEPFAMLSIPIGRTYCKSLQDSFKQV